MNDKRMGASYSRVRRRSVRSVEWIEGDGSKYSGKLGNSNRQFTAAIVSDGAEDLRGSFNEHGVERGPFEYCARLETVRLPGSISRIGENAFLNCKALVHVDIPSGVNEIGGSAFCGCASIETVIVPEGVVDLSENTFRSCGSLRSVRLPSSLKTIGREALYFCFSLTSINFEALRGVAEIGKAAFAKCSSLTAFDLPPLLKTIERETFFQCHSLSEVELPPSLEKIGSRAFCRECSRNLLSIDLPETVTSVGEAALSGCRVRLPTSLSMLSSGKEFSGVLQGVKEVVMSSRVNLELLVGHLRAAPKRKNGIRFLDPNLTFKVLHSCCSSAAPPMISEHVTESFFSFDVSYDTLVLLLANEGKSSLLARVASAFERKVSLYAGLLLRSRATKLPEEVLCEILSFAFGQQFANGGMLAIMKEAENQLNYTN